MSEPQTGVAGDGHPRTVQYEPAPNVCVCGTDRDRSPCPEECPTRQEPTR